MGFEDTCNSTARAFGSVAQRYTDKYFDLTDYQPQLDRFLSGLNAQQNAVLDLACGPGNVSAYLLQQAPHLHVLGLDLAPEMIEIARQKVPGAVFEVGDCRELSGLGQSFDAAVFAFGLSYLSDADAARCLQSLHAQLRPGAWLFLSTLTGEPTQSGAAELNGHRLHTFYRPAAAVLTQLRSAGFTPSFHELVASPANASVSTQDLIVIARRSGRVGGLEPS